MTDQSCLFYPPVEVRGNVFEILHTDFMKPVNPVIVSTRRYAVADPVGAKAAPPPSPHYLKKIFEIYCEILKIGNKSLKLTMNFM
jgi:hypothetical protein